MRQVLRLVVLVAVLGLVCVLAPAEKAQASTCPTCGAGTFCCTQSFGPGLCVSETCPFADSCCLINCRWTIC